PAAFLEVEARGHAVAIGFAAVEIIALLLVVLRLVRRNRLAAAGGALGPSISQLGVAPEQCDTFLEATAIDNDKAELLERIGHVRPQRQRAPIGRLGLGELAALIEDIAEIAVRRSMV